MSRHRRIAFGAIVVSMALVTGASTRAGPRNAGVTPPGPSPRLPTRAAAHVAFYRESHPTGLLPAQDSIAVIIRSRLDGTAITDGEPALELDALRRFYSRRDWAPAWLASPTAQASLLGALRTAAAQGLDSSVYHLAGIEARVPLATGADARLQAETDLLLSDAYLAYATHRAIGRIDPRSFLAGWREAPRAFDAVASLVAALDTLGPARALELADPTGHRFRELGAALAALRDSSAWSTVPVGASIEPGDSGPRVAALRRRLDPGASDSMLTAPFDERLAGLVRDFQMHHGLEADGIAGRRTVAALNVPIDQRTRQIVLGMERLRWLREPTDATHIEVLIPAFELRMYESGRVRFYTRVVGGSRGWPTPSLTSAITEIVVNPYWNIPVRILALEVLPQAVQDPTYFAKHDMEILSPGGTRIPVASIDWARVDPWDFDYRVRQRPGPENPLGRVKFVIGSPFDVYLHDTPAQAAFERADRAMSHGCVRVQGTLDLANLVMEGAPSWTGATLDSLIATGTPQTVSTPHSVPVEIIYLTAWVGDDGRVQFRDDIYDMDADLEKRLADATTGPRADPMSGDCSSGM